MSLMINALETYHNFKKSFCLLYKVSIMGYKSISLLTPKLVISFNVYFLLAQTWLQICA